uniref:Uncharacterized protein n=1 Tax=Anguilla anguilla TaxID=7936 RepID=A0A0E9TEP3_ANGAN
MYIQDSSILIIAPSTGRLNVLHPSIPLGKFYCHNQHALPLLPYIAQSCLCFMHRIFDMKLEHQQNAALFGL